MHNCANAQMPKCTNTQLLKCPNASLLNAQMHNCLMHKCTPVMANAQMLHTQTNAKIWQMRNYTTAFYTNAHICQMLRGSNTQLLYTQMHTSVKCSDAQLHDCFIHKCTHLLNAQRLNYTTALYTQMHTSVRCSDAQLHNCFLHKCTHLLNAQTDAQIHELLNAPMYNYSM